MLNRISIKAKLYILAGVSVLGLLFSSLLLYNSLSSIYSLSNAEVLVEKLNSNMLALRREEKDFLSRKDLKFKETYSNVAKTLKDNSLLLEENLKKNHISTENLESFEKLVKEYESIFFELLSKQQKIGLTPKNGLYGTLRSAVHKVQTFAKESKNNELLAIVYDLRKQEKDFMLRRDMKYVDKFTKIIDSLIKRDDLLNSESKKDLLTYKKDFFSLVEAEQEMGLDSSLGIQFKMRSTIQKTEEILEKMSQHVSKEVASAIDKDKIIAFVASIIIILLIILFSLTISRSIATRLEGFQKGLLEFFKYLNREISDVKPLSANKYDEVGIMATVVNENIVKIKESIEEDRRVIDNTIEILSEYEKGAFEKKVSIKTSNPSLNELTTLINKMGTNLEKNIDIILNILGQYTNSNFLNRVPTQGLKDHVLELANGVNTLAGAITTILLDNKRHGVEINNSAFTLFQNIKTLNRNSNEAAAALEETAAAVEEIASNVTRNTETIVEMANYANELNKAASQGQDLATQTTKSMDEINNQVTSINEAITVIDQIAFQTNILSLNAAVEAATAGEAGKGFAVVAQEVRNLASRSAEAAKEIKDLVENANLKANSGKKIADTMIKGYNSLNENVGKTISLISNVETASKEQLTGIHQINDAINSLDQQTQQNAAVANQTQEIASSTSDIASIIIEDANKKEFEGKNSIDETEKLVDVQSKAEVTIKKVSPKTSPKKEDTKVQDSKKDEKIEPKNNSSDDEWESF